MAFYEVIYETPGVDEVRAGKKWHQLPNLWGEGRADLNTRNCWLHCCKSSPTTGLAERARKGWKISEEFFLVLRISESLLQESIF